MDVGTDARPLANFAVPLLHHAPPAATAHRTGTPAGAGGARACDRLCFRGGGAGAEGAAGAGAERRKQLWFTGLMMLYGLVYCVQIAFEVRWINGCLGEQQFAAYSVAHSAIGYLWPMSSLWGGVTALVGTAHGAGDHAAVSKYTKMTLALAGGVAALAWLFYLSLGGWLMRDVYEVPANLYVYAVRLQGQTDRGLRGLT